MTKTLQLHENNKNFSWSIPEGPYSFFSDEEISCFNENGYVVVEEASSTTT